MSYIFYQQYQIIIGCSQVDDIKYRCKSSEIVHFQPLPEVVEKSFDGIAFVNTHVFDPPTKA